MFALRNPTMLGLVYALMIALAGATPLHAVELEDRGQTEMTSNDTNIVVRDRIRHPLLPHDFPLDGYAPHRDSRKVVLHFKGSSGDTFRYRQGSLQNQDIYQMGKWVGQEPGSKRAFQIDILFGGPGQRHPDLMPFQLDIPGGGKPTCWFKGNQTNRAFDPWPKDAGKTLEWTITTGDNYLSPCGSKSTFGIALVCEDPSATCKV